MGQAYCKVCDAGRYRPSNSASRVSCLDCDAGKFLSDAGNDATRHDTANDCSTCSLGTKSGNGAENCDKCPLGKFNDDAAANPLNHVTCSDCPKGQFQDSLGKSECFECELGKYNTRTGRAQESDCRSCDPCQAGNIRENCGGGIGTDGNKHTDSGGFCTKCLKGKYKDILGAWNSECQQCPEGKVALKVGTSTASTCLFRFFLLFNCFFVFFHYYYIILFFITDISTLLIFFSSINN
jgi:hypothetical protein